MADEVFTVAGSEQIDILAPPAEIRVSVGVGAEGKRGSRFYAGNQTPELFFAALGEAPNVYDLYLNTTSQQMFQYVSTPAGNVWSVLFDLTALMSANIEAAVTAAMSEMFEISSPTDGQVLTYDSSIGRWVNE